MKTNYFNAPCLWIVALCYIITNTEAAFCHADTGPSGLVLCRKYSEFNDTQLATCRTDKYIRSKNNGTHYCSHTYCLYPCMVEKYGITSGGVNDTCRCSIGSTSSPSSPSSPASPGSPGKTGPCNGNSGPRGTRQCIKNSEYNDYQWATCRTDTYIRAKTNGTRYCSRTYCSFRCMVEKYGITSGVVNDTCRCSPSSPASTGSPGKMGQCNAYRGPNGARQCIKISGYTDYQWATCRRDSYLKSTSGGKHHCLNRSSTYCLYQCMLEKYDESSGEVLSSCRCTPTDSASKKEKYTRVFVVLVAISSLLVS